MRKAIQKVSTLAIVLVVLTIWLATSVVAPYPSKRPFMDKCVGTKKVACLGRPKRSAGCIWNEQGAPDCFEKSYFYIKTFRELDPLDTVVRFFEFSYGVHLSDGTNQQIHVVHEVGECAQLCLASTGASGVRCLSFDYYPHERPDPNPPFNETARSGICILNSENSDTARLRNTDMGSTDAELFYKSHFTRRPFSGEEGYYQLRDVRGGEIAKMLEYSKGVQFNANNIWPRSRWGIMYLDFPIEIATGYICDEPDDEPYNASLIIDPAVGSSVELSLDASGRFTGAYTPVDWDQHCVGKMFKPKAADLCLQSGGALCSQQQLKMLRLAKLGCNLDNFPMWAKEDLTPRGVQKFVRCCSTFYVLNICPFFSRTQMDFCGSLRDESECIEKGGGYARQAQFGFGKLRDYYKEQCRLGNLPCKGMVSDWRSRDSCIWCTFVEGTQKTTWPKNSRTNAVWLMCPGPKPGDLEGGTGECRAGNDIGVCKNAPLDMQRLFALKVKAQCTSKVACRISTRYEEKAVLFDAWTPRPTTASPTVPTDSPTFAPTGSPTRKPTPPTRRPTSTSPTKSPTTRPTMSPTTSQPTLSPTTSRPSLTPTGSPTMPQPSLSPSTSTPSDSPTTSAPSASPSTSPSKQPSSSPTTSPTSAPTDPV